MRHLILLLVSLASASVSTDVLANDYVLADDYVAVRARLTGTDPNFTYTVEKNGRTHELQTPSATFEIMSPKFLAGRKVRIYFYLGDLTDLLDKSEEAFAEIYSIELYRANTELDGEIEVSDYQINRLEAVHEEK